MKGLLALCFVGGLALPFAAAGAADWPTKPVRIIVPFAAGGAADAQGRLYGDALSAAFGKQFIIENRTGGGGLIAAEAVARAAPDGYTLLVSGIPIQVLAPAMNRNVGYDPMRDFTHIAYFGGTPNVLVTHPSLGVKSYRESSHWRARRRTASIMSRPAWAPWATGSPNIWRRRRASGSPMWPTRAALRHCSISSPAM